MQNGLYVAVSAQVALQRRLETIADNVANMNTVGYRATGVSFEKEMARAGEAKLAYVSPGSDYLSRGIGGWLRPTTRSTSPCKAMGGSRSKRRRARLTPATAARGLMNRE
jgi:flagellar hook protein FlgE